MWKRYAPPVVLVVAGVGTAVAGWSATDYLPLLRWVLGVVWGIAFVFWAFPRALAAATYRRIGGKALAGQLGLPPAGACFIFYPSGDGQTFTATVRVNPLMISPERMRQMLRAHAEIFDWDERLGVDQ